MTESRTSTAEDRFVAHGVLGEIRGDRIVFKIPETDYQLELVAAEKVVASPGERIAGTIRAQARRIDVIRSGGRYIEPVNGRPRRVQGRIVDIDTTKSTVTVNAVVPIVCRTNDLQSAEQFEVGQLVSFDVTSGATFTPML
ncbi:MAG: hypothetical protein EA376_11470 [Phycisphaeraceae bacterium]|nr:MAG: hypothetical protein EA376_11470 [Phycisphaeraceae bacterium]